MKLRSLVILSSLMLPMPFMMAEQGSAARGVNVGTLRCEVNPTVGLIVGSSTGMNCRFDAAGNHRRHIYQGNISKLGLDIGITSKSYVSWLVFAPGKIEPSALAGSYGGASAQATVGVGLGANVLVGGSNKSIALQPVSVQGQTGLNVAAGIAGLRLRFVK
jgi:hypothetical protein